MIKSRWNGYRSLKFSGCVCYVCCVRVLGGKDWAGGGADSSGSSIKLPMQVLLNPYGSVDLSALINNQMLSPESRDCIRGHVQFQDLAIIFCLYALADFGSPGQFPFHHLRY